MALVSWPDCTRCQRFPRCVWEGGSLARCFWCGFKPEMFVSTNQRLFIFSLFRVRNPVRVCSLYFRSYNNMRTVHWTFLCVCVFMNVQENMVATFEHCEVSINAFFEFKRLKCCLLFLCAFKKRVPCTQPLLVELSEAYRICVRANCCIHLLQPI